VRQVEQTFDYTPFHVGAPVSVLTLLAVAVLALVIAARPGGVAQSLSGLGRTSFAGR
jgi:hypothetical protein